MSSTEALEITSPTQEKTDGWFSNTVHHWGTKRMLYNTQALPPKEARVYEGLAQGNVAPMLEMVTEASHKYYITNLLDRYEEAIRDIPYELLAFDWQRSKV